MSQTDLVISDDTTANMLPDLNAHIQALGTLMAGTTAPTTTYANQYWLDTSAAPWVLKVRNAANDAWITVLEIDDTDDTVRLVAKLLTMSGQILAAGGSVGAPGMAFSGDPDTGHYSSGADLMAGAAGGTKIYEFGTSKFETLKELIVTGAAQVGIETLTSSTAISVDLSGKYQKELVLNHSGTITFTNLAAGRGCAIRIEQGVTGGQPTSWAGGTTRIWANGNAEPTLGATQGDVDWVYAAVAADAATIDLKHVAP